MLACMSDASMLGCETTIQFSEYVTAISEFSSERKLSVQMNTSQAQVTDWANLEGLGIRVEQTIQEVPAECYVSSQQIDLLIDGQSGISMTSVGQINSSGTYIFLIPYTNLSERPTSFADLMRDQAVCLRDARTLRPEEVVASIGPFSESCFGDLVNVSSYAASFQPYNYHASGKCMSWQTCQECLRAGCNWCEWNCDSNCEPLPPWIPDYDTVQQAFNEGSGCCGIHPFVCRETTGTFNACRDSVKPPRDLIWSFALFVIPIVFVYCIFQLKKNRSLLLS